MRNYYIAKNESSVGPFSIEQLKHQGILPETKVWYEGLPDWVEARTLAELSELFPIVMAVPPPIRDVESERLGRSTAFWRVVAVGTFVVMIGVAAWKYGGWRPFERNADPEPTVVVDPVDPNPMPDPEELKKAEYRENWSKHVDCYVESADPGEFGGFSNIKMRVKNDMPYTIEQMEIVVEYTLKNGEKRISKKKSVANIQAKGFSELVPFEATNRGVKLEPKIIGIMCSEIGLSYSEY